MSLGIAVLNYNRFGASMACLESIVSFTSTPHRLILADDGSPDESARRAQARGYEVVGKGNRGVAWNYNRALWTLRECDTIILVEADMWPIVDGWEIPWIEASRRWGQVNYAYECVTPPAGAGTAEDPWRCEAFGSQVVATSQTALQRVGYQDPRFYAWKYSIAHAEWTFRFSRALNWPRFTMNDTPPCLRHGLRPVDVGSVYDPSLIAESSELLVRIVNEDAYRLPWKDEMERDKFLNDVNTRG